MNPSSAYVRVKSLRMCGGKFWSGARVPVGAVGGGSCAANGKAVRTTRAAAKARADAAFRNVQDSFSIAAIGNRYQARLTEIQAIIDTTDDAA